MPPSNDGPVPQQGRKRKSRETYDDRTYYDGPSNSHQSLVPHSRSSRRTPLMVQSAMPMGSASRQLPVSQGSRLMSRPSGIQHNTGTSPVPKTFQSNPFTTLYTQHPQSASLTSVGQPYQANRPAAYQNARIQTSSIGPVQTSSTNPFNYPTNPLHTPIPRPTVLDATDTRLNSRPSAHGLHSTQPINLLQPRGTNQGGNQNFPTKNMSQNAFNPAFDTSVQTTRWDFVNNRLMQDCSSQPIPQRLQGYTSPQSLPGNYRSSNLINPPAHGISPAESFSDSSSNTSLFQTSFLAQAPSSLQAERPVDYFSDISSSQALFLPPSPFSNLPEAADYPSNNQRPDDLFLQPAISSTQISGQANLDYSQFITPTLPPDNHPLPADSSRLVTPANRITADKFPVDNGHHTFLGWPAGIAAPSESNEPEETHLQSHGLQVHPSLHSSQVAPLVPQMQFQAPSSPQPDAPAPPGLPSAAAGVQNSHIYICDEVGCGQPTRAQTKRSRKCRDHMENPPPRSRESVLDEAVAAGHGYCTGCNGRHPRRAPGRSCWECYCKHKCWANNTCDGCPAVRCPNRTFVDA